MCARSAIAPETMELKVADDVRDAIEHPLRVEDRLVLHARHVVEVDDDPELVEELEQRDRPCLLGLLVFAFFERPGFFHEAHDGGLGRILRRDGEDGLVAARFSELVRHREPRFGQRLVQVLQLVIPRGAHDEPTQLENVRLRVREGNNERSERV